MRPLTKNIVFNVYQASLLLSAGSVLAGLAASVLRGGIVLFPAIMTLLCAMLFQVSSNLYFSYRQMKYVMDSGTLERDALTPSGYLVMKTLSYVFAILALTMALPLFMRLKGLTAVYLVVIFVLVYFHFSGPRPLMSTRWSILVTFLLFGPIAVSGTALIQNRYSPDWSYIVVYAFISGLLAVNSHLSIQHLRRHDDMRSGIKTLQETHGRNFVRTLYLVNIIAVCALMVFCPDHIVGLDSHWIGAILSVWLLASGFIVFRKMREDDNETAMKIRLLVISQYVSAMIALLCIVLFSMDDYWVKMLMVK